MKNFKALLITLTLALCVTSGFAVVNSSAADVQEEEVCIALENFGGPLLYRACVKVILPGASSAINGPCSIDCGSVAATACAIARAKAIYGNNISTIVVATPLFGQYCW